MDPRNENLKKHRHIHVGQIVGMYFRSGQNGTLTIKGPAVMNVTRQGHYLHGRGQNFEFHSLEEYDKETGLLFQRERGVVEGVLTFGMVNPKETPEAAMARLAPRVVPDIAALWRQVRRREQVDAMALQASLAGGLSGNLRKLGIDPANVRFVSDDDPNEGCGLPMP